MRKKQEAAAPAAGSLRVPAQQEVALSSIREAPYNPRVMPPEKMRALCASLVKHGMVLNLVVQRKSAAYGDMVLVGGHQRLRAMRRVCEERGWAPPAAVPAVVLDVADADAKQLNVALNSIEGDFDPHKLGLLFAEVRPLMSADDVVATGFGEENIAELIKLSRDPERIAEDLEGSTGELAGFGASITLSLEFSTTARRDEAKELARAAATERKCKAGDVVLDVLKSARLSRAGRKAK